MASDQELSSFLRSVEKRAFKRTVYSVRNDDAALDIVQDAMVRLAEHYADRPAAEWPLLFQRILSNATMDWFRREKVRSAVFQPLPEPENAARLGDHELLEVLRAVEENAHAESADTAVGRVQVLAAIEEEVSRLPPRQREAFLLRYLEEFNLAETATAMGCTEGSVKTHCSRAVHALAQALRARGMAP